MIPLQGAPSGARVRRTADGVKPGRPPRTRKEGGVREGTAVRFEDLLDLALMRAAQPSGVGAGEETPRPLPDQTPAERPLPSYGEGMAERLLRAYGGR